MTEPISGDPFRPAPLPGPGPVPGSAPAPLGAPVAPPLPPAPAPVRARGGGAFLNVLLGVALVVAVGGVAFAAGRVTAPAAVATTRGGFGNGNGGGFAGGPNASGAPGGFGGGAFGGAGITIQGTVTAVSADSLTLQLTSGQTVTIPTDSSTTYHQRETATAAAVTNGSSVIVQLAGGRGVFGNGGQGGGATASGAPGRTTPTAISVTVAPSGS